MSPEWDPPRDPKERPKNGLAPKWHKGVQGGGSIVNSVKGLDQEGPDAPAVPELQKEPKRRHPTDGFAATSAADRKGPMQLP